MSNKDVPWAFHEDSTQLVNYILKEPEKLCCQPSKLPRGHLRGILK